MDIIAVPEIYDALRVLFKWKIRGLTSKEKALAKAFLSDELWLKLIKVDEHAKWTAKNKNIAYVSFFTINTFGSMRDETYIHELIHLWQYTRFGSEYIVQALFAQISEEGYNYGGFQNLFRAFGENRSILSFNFEQQGDILADYFSLVENKAKMRHTDFRLKSQVYLFFVQQLKELPIYRW